MTSRRHRLNKTSSVQSKRHDPYQRILADKPFDPKNDQHLISPYKISPESNVKVTRIMEMITNLGNSRLLKIKKTLCLHREQNGEYVY